MSSSLNNQTIDSSWVDLAVALPQIAGQRVVITHLKGGAANVAFSRLSTPPFLPAPSIDNGGVKEGVAPHVWVKSQGGRSTLGITLLGAEDSQAQAVPAGYATSGFMPKAGVPFNVSLSASAASSAIFEKSYPGEGVWYQCWRDFSAIAAGTNITDRLTEAEADVAYRLRVTAGSVNIRFSQPGDDGVGALIPAAPPVVPAPSSPLAGNVADVAAHVFGPFTPQLKRDIWATLVGAGASGTAQVLRSTDAGATKAGLTAGGKAWASWSFTGLTGSIVNEQIGTETDAAATYYLAVTLTAGSLTYRLAQ